MLIASGNLNIKELISGAIDMANNTNTVHELSMKEGKGSFKHPHGWGIAYLDENNSWVIKKSIKPIYEDPETEQLQGIKTKLVIIHARRSTEGRTALVNTHPFHVNNKELGEFVFCHNGHLRDKIFFSPKFKPKGDTDSERLLYSILTNMKSNQDEAIQEAITKTIPQYNACKGTNIILSSKEKSYIAIKENLMPRYYNLHLGKSKDMIIISSEVLPDLKNVEWQEFGYGTMFILENKTTSMEIKTGIQFTPQQNLSFVRSF